MKDGYIRPEENTEKFPRQLGLLLIELYARQRGMEVVNVEFVDTPEASAKELGYMTQETVIG